MFNSKLFTRSSIEVIPGTMGSLLYSNYLFKTIIHNDILLSKPSLR